MNFSMMMLLMLLMVVVMVSGAPNPSPPTKPHFIVVDAGSSHTQMYMYSYAPRASSSSTAPFSILSLDDTPFASPNHANISWYADHGSLSDLGPAVLQPLLDHAQSKLSSMRGQWDSVPFHVAATAGMRTVPAARRSAVMDAASAYLTAHSPFDNHVAVLSGEEEGMYGWICVNYLLRGAAMFAATSPTVGALDLGGASTQITFEVPPFSGLANTWTMPTNVAAAPLRSVYAHSYLQYGINDMLSRQRAALAPAVEDPCLNDGFEYTRATDNATVSGASITFEVCRQLLRAKLFDNFSDTDCYTEGECAFNGVYQPPVANTVFYAFSTFGNIMSDVGLAPNATLDAVEAEADNVCAMNKTELLATFGADNKYASAYCVDLTYVSVLLKDGYRFGGQTSGQLVWVTGDNGINGESVDWARGYAVYHVNLMSWQVPSCAEKTVVVVVLAVVLGVVVSVLVVMFVRQQRAASNMKSRSGGRGGRGGGSRHRRSVGDDVIVVPTNSGNNYQRLEERSSSSAVDEDDI